MSKLEQVLSSKTIIRDVSSLFGRIVALFEVLANRRLYYENIESEKILALKQCKGNLEAKCGSSPPASLEIEWWKANTIQVYQDVKPLLSIDYTIYNNASTKDWGSFDENLYINMLELLKVCNLFPLDSRKSSSEL